MPGVQRAFGQVLHRAFWIVALASPRGRYHCTVLAVRREHAMKASQIDAGLRHQRRQSGDEVSGSNSTWVVPSR